MADDRSPPIPGTAGYAQSADQLAVRYESIPFAVVHRPILHLLPTAPCDALDIGAGTGRDAAALAALGHRVVAIEPTAEMRAHGKRLHPSPSITWIDDALPDLARFDAGQRLFDLIMLTAVWMHLHDAERPRALARVSGLLRPGGLMCLTLRHGPVPQGRRMFEVSAEETCGLARAGGLTLVHRSERDGMHGQKDVRWSVLAFRRSRDGIGASSANRR